MGFGSRLPDSNDPPRPKSKWGSQSEVYDDFAALLNGDARRCAGCKCPTLVEHLDADSKCPDCRETKSK